MPLVYDEILLEELANIYRTRGGGGRSGSKAEKDDDPFFPVPFVEIGTREEVWTGIAKRTGSRLYRKDFKRNNSGRIVSSGKSDSIKEKGSNLGDYLYYEDGFPCEKPPGLPKGRKGKKVIMATRQESPHSPNLDEETNFPEIPILDPNESEIISNQQTLFGTGIRRKSERISKLGTTTETTTGSHNSGKTDSNQTKKKTGQRDTTKSKKNTGLPRNSSKTKPKKKTPTQASRGSKKKKP